MADTTKCGPPSASEDARVILVVHDDPSVRGLVAGILTEAGYAVLTAGDREGALVLVRTLDDRLGLLVVGSGPLEAE